MVELRTSDSKLRCQNTVIQVYTLNHFISRGQETNLPPILIKHGLPLLTLKVSVTIAVDDIFIFLFVIFFKETKS